MKKIIAILFLGLALLTPQKSFAVTYTQADSFINPYFDVPSLSPGLGGQYFHSERYFVWTGCINSGCGQQTDQKNVFLFDGINKTQLTNFPDPAPNISSTVTISLTGITNGIVNWTENGVARSYVIPSYVPPPYIPTPDFSAGISSGKMVLTLSNGTTVNLTRGILFNGSTLYLSNVTYFKQSGNNLLWMNGNDSISFYNYDLNTVFFNRNTIPPGFDQRNLDGNTFFFAHAGDVLNTINYRTFRTPTIGLPLFAAAGDDIEARANQLVTLNGSDSSDPDGSITGFQWQRLPDHQLLCAFSSSPTCQFRTLGRAEEVIELMVRDNDNNFATDTMSIFYSLPNPGTPVCGNSQIEAGEICDSNSQTCVTGSGYAGTMNCNAQCTGYAVCTSSQSCGDGIKNGNEQCDGTAGVGANQTCSTLCTLVNNPTFSFFVLAKDMQTKTSGLEVSDGWNLTTNGYLGQYINFPKTGLYVVKVIARGELAGSVLPKLQFRVDQVVKGTISVGSTAMTTHQVSINALAGSHELELLFTNDFKDGSGDRNLVVQSVQVGQ